MEIFNAIFGFLLITCLFGDRWYWEGTGIGAPADPTSTMAARQTDEYKG